MTTNAQRKAKRRWIEKNPDKVAAQKARYRKRHPEKTREQRLKYLDRKFKVNPELMKKLKGQLHNDFNRLTRILFDGVLPKKCAVCSSEWDLQIHHKRYAYPILLEDLERLCRKHHIEEHQKLL